MTDSPHQTLSRRDDVLHHLREAQAAGYRVVLRCPGLPEHPARFDGFDPSGRLLLRGLGPVPLQAKVGTVVLVHARGAGGTMEFLSSLAGWDRSHRLVLVTPQVLTLQAGRRRGPFLVSDGGAAVLDVTAKDGLIRMEVVELTRRGVVFHCPAGPGLSRPGRRLTGTLRVKGRGGCRLHLEVRHARRLEEEDGLYRVGAQIVDLDDEQRTWLSHLAELSRVA